MIIICNYLLVMYNSVKTPINIKYFTLRVNMKIKHAFALSSLVLASEKWDLKKFIYVRFRSGASPRTVPNQGLVSLWCHQFQFAYFTLIKILPPKQCLKFYVVQLLLSIVLPGTFFLPSILKNKNIVLYNCLC